MTNKIWVDPPSGWRYGFPRVYNENTDGPILEWMVKCGYPQPLIDDYGDHFYMRQWHAEEAE